jgi:hypothetical protein
MAARRLVAAIQDEARAAVAAGWLTAQRDG